MSVLKMSLFATTLSLSLLLLGAGSRAEAGDVRVVVPFYPRADFQTDRGTFRTHDGHYYHYDRDRDGWHYGRNHSEGLRYERRHPKK